MRHLLQHRPARHYALGQLLIVLGAASIGPTGSLLPMALATSAGIMMSVPLLRERLARLQAARAGRR